MEKITILPTREMMTIDGVRGRVWEGISESGVRCKLLVHRIAVIDGQDDGAFVRGLLDARAVGIENRVSRRAGVLSDVRATE